MSIPWGALLARFGGYDVRASSPTQATVVVRFDETRRRQHVGIEMHENIGGATVLCISSDSLSPARAAAVFAASDRSDDALALDAVPWLTVLAHNDRLRFVSLRPGVDAIAVAEDIVVLPGTSLDASAVIAAIERVARVADGLEMRATAEDER